MLSILLIMIIPISMVLFAIFFDEKNVKKTNTIRYSEKLRKQEYWTTVSKQNKKLLFIAGIILFVINILVIISNNLNTKTIIMILIIQIVAYSILMYVPQLVAIKNRR